MLRRFPLRGLPQRAHVRDEGAHVRRAQTRPPARCPVDVFNLIGYLTRADTLEAGTPCGWSFVTAFSVRLERV
jgi:hypothetical protein